MLLRRSATGSSSASTRRRRWGRARRTDQVEPPEVTIPAPRARRNRGASSPASAVSIPSPARLHRPAAPAPPVPRARPRAASGGRGPTDRLGPPALRALARVRRRAGVSRHVPVRSVRYPNGPSPASAEGPGAALPLGHRRRATMAVPPFKRTGIVEAGQDTGAGRRCSPPPGTATRAGRFARVRPTAGTRARSSMPAPPGRPRRRRHLFPWSGRWSASHRTALDWRPTGPAPATARCRAAVLFPRGRCRRPCAQAPARPPALVGSSFPRRGPGPLAAPVRKSPNPRLFATRR